MRILRLFFGSWNLYELTKLANSARFRDGLALAYAKNHRMSTSTWIEFWLANFWLFDRKLHSIGNQNWSIWRLYTVYTPKYPKLWEANCLRFTKPSTLTMIITPPTHFRVKSGLNWNLPKKNAFLRETTGWFGPSQNVCQAGGVGLHSPNRFRNLTERCQESQAMQTSVTIQLACKSLSD